MVKISKRSKLEVMLDKEVQRFQIWPENGPNIRMKVMKAKPKHKRKK